MSELGLVFSEPAGPDGPLVVEQLPVLTPWEWDSLERRWVRWTAEPTPVVAVTATGGTHPELARHCADVKLREMGYRLL